MDIARVEKRIGVQATTDRIWELIADLPDWGRWNPVESQVEGAIVFGGQIGFTETIEGLAPRQGVGRVGEWQPYAQLVWVERRGLWFNVMRYFEIEELAPGNCIFANGMIFSGLRGELSHDRHRLALRRAVESVAEGMKAAAEA
jgi:hypothetical protein